MNSERKLHLAERVIAHPVTEIVMCFLGLWIITGADASFADNVTGLALVAHRNLIWPRQQTS